MTNNIGAITGGGSGNVFWNNKSASNENQEAAVSQEQQAPQAEYQEVNPDDVMAFLAQNNNFVDLVKGTAPNGIETDPTIAERVAGYMENYEFIMGIIEQEFGPERAPLVMDVVMDKLMGMVD